MNKKELISIQKLEKIVLNMSCNCNKAKSLPSCLTSIIIGEVADTAVDYLAIMKTPDGRTDIFEAFNVYGTSQMAIAPAALRVGTEYELWLTEASANNIEERAAFTIGDDSLTCVAIEFYQVHGDDNDLETFATQTISLV